jgi:arylformamidase
MRPLGLLATILALSLAAAGCASPRPDSEPPSSTTPIPTTIASTTTAPDCSGAGVGRRTVEQYLEAPGPDPDLSTLEVIRPDLPDGCGPTPVAVWVHGGGWAIGDRRNQLDDKVDLFTSMGWTLVSVNYRLTPEVQYPVHNDDVAAAVGWVMDHADELGVDPGRVTVMGHSAGAGIAAAVAVDPQHLASVGHEPSELRCAVLVDTEGYDVERMAGEGVEIYLEAFGDDPAVWRAASPIHQVDPSTHSPRSLVITRGTPRRIDAATAFVDALVGAEVEAQLLEASPLTHAQVNEVIGVPGDRVVTPTLVEFLSDC